MTSYESSELLCPKHAVISHYSTSLVRETDNVRLAHEIFRPLVVDKTRKGSRETGLCGERHEGWPENEWAVNFSEMDLGNIYEDFAFWRGSSFSWKC